MRRFILISFVAACVFAPGPTAVSAQTRTIAFDTDEGTWLSLDVAPTGETLVMELLGDLYTLSSQGGAATAPPLVSSPAPGPYGAAEAADGSVYFTSVTDPASPTRRPRYP